MPTSTDISLPGDSEPDWPDRCIACGTPAPGRSMTYISFFAGVRAMLGPIGGFRTAHPPVCARCKPRLRLFQLTRWALTAAVIIAGIAFAAYVFGGRAKPPGRYTLIGGALVIVFPYLLVRHLFPPVFDLTPYSRRTVFEFRDRDYALDFQMKNQHPDLYDRSRPGA